MFAEISGEAIGAGCAILAMIGAMIGHWIKSREMIAKIESRLSEVEKSAVSSTRFVKVETEIAGKLSAIEDLARHLKSVVSELQKSNIELTRVVDRLTTLEELRGREMTRIVKATDELKEKTADLRKRLERIEEI